MNTREKEGGSTDNRSDIQKIKSKAGITS